MRREIQATGLSPSILEDESLQQLLIWLLPFVVIWLVVIILEVRFHGLLQGPARFVVLHEVFSSPSVFGRFRDSDMMCRRL